MADYPLISAENIFFRAGDRDGHASIRRSSVSSSLISCRSRDAVAFGRLIAESPCISERFWRAGWGCRSGGCGLMRGQGCSAAIVEGDGILAAEQIDARYPPSPESHLFEVEDDRARP